MRLSETPAQTFRAGPLLGEHSAKVLEEVGYSPDEIRRLEQAGIIRQSQ